MAAPPALSVWAEEMKPQTVYTSQGKFLGFFSVGKLSLGAMRTVRPAHCFEYSLSSLRISYCAYAQRALLVRQAHQAEEKAQCNLRSPED